MGDGPSGIKVISDYFQASPPRIDSLQIKTSSISHPKKANPEVPRPFLDWKKLRSVVSMLNLFNLRGLPWGSGSDDQEKVVLMASEVESLRSELADLEERGAYLKARLDNLDEILRSARLSGYLYIRTRWAALPGEPPPIDDAEVDDWLPRFVVLHGSCIFFYLLSTDLSPQDSTLLSDITEVGPLPCLTREEEETRYCFYILTRHGLRYECSNVSKIQVDSWLRALQSECKFEPASEALTVTDSIKA
ncbi:hypothetical protein NMG60_11030547 [Bertholletia excelsa]